MGYELLSELIKNNETRLFLEELFNNSYPFTEEKAKQVLVTRLLINIDQAREIDIKGREEFNKGKHKEALIYRALAVPSLADTKYKRETMYSYLSISESAVNLGFSNIATEYFDRALEVTADLIKAGHLRAIPHRLFDAVFKKYPNLKIHKFYSLSNERESNRLWYTPRYPDISDEQLDSIAEEKAKNYIRNLKVNYRVR